MKRVRGVEGRAAVDTAVGIVIGNPKRHPAVQHAPNADAEGRATGRDHGRVEDHRRVRRIGIRLEPALRAGAAALLFPVDEEVQPYAELATCGEALSADQQHEQVALVVAGAARIEVALAHDGLERRRPPEIRRPDRLDVVVAVDDHPAAVAGAHGAVNQRMPAVVGDPGLRAGPLQLLLHEGRSARHVRIVLGQRADAGNPQEGVQPRSLIVVHSARLRCGGQGLGPVP
jgi:hypothetical protein